MQAGLPEARLRIVGRDPTAEVLSLANLPGVAVPVQLLSMAPYLATIIVLVAISARQKFSRRAGGTAPGSLGQDFHALR